MPSIQIELTLHTKELTRYFRMGVEAAFLPRENEIVFLPGIDVDLDNPGIYWSIVDGALIPIVQVGCERAIPPERFDAECQKAVRAGWREF